LNHLSDLLNRPKNRLINEAVRLYVQQKSREVEHELEDTLRALRTYRQKDPAFKNAINEFIEAEAKFASDDPAEGRQLGAQGEVQSQIRRKLNAA